MEKSGQKVRAILIGSALGSVLVVAAVVMLGVTSGTGQTGAQATGVTGGAADISGQLDDLASGESRLTVSGAVAGTREFTTGTSEPYAGTAADVFRPARGKGDYKGTNADGPYELRVYTDVRREAESDEAIRAWVSIILPPDATPGDHAITARRDATGSNAYASFAGDGYAWRFARDVEGRLFIDRLDDAVSAAWRFEASDGSGESVRVSGAVHDLAFSPQAESRLSMSVNGETRDHFGRLSVNRDSRGRRIMTLVRDVYLELPASPSEGSHPVKLRRQADSDITLNLFDQSVDSVEGTVTIEPDGAMLTGVYSLTATGADTVRLNGEFSYPTTD